MKLNTAEQIKEALHGFSFLEESPIVLIAHKQFGTKVFIYCFYPWERPGVLRKDLSVPKYLKLSFFLVRRFVMIYGLTQTMIENPDEVGPAIVEIHTADYVGEFPSEPSVGIFPQKASVGNFHRIRFDLEFDGHLEIDFKEIEIAHESVLPGAADDFCRFEIDGESQSAA